MVLSTTLVKLVGIAEQNGTNTIKLQANTCSMDNTHAPTLQLLPRSDMINFFKSQSCYSQLQGSNVHYKIKYNTEVSKPALLNNVHPTLVSHPHCHRVCGGCTVQRILTSLHSKGTAVTPADSILHKLSLLSQNYDRHISGLYTDVLAIDCFHSLRV